MFRKEENPGLFKEICKTLNVNFDYVNELTDIALDNIYILSLEAKNGSDVRSLNGIEKLHNLKALYITGARDTDENLWEVYQKNNQLSDIEDYYFNQNQLQDFTPLNKCKELTTLWILDQHNLVGLDCANMSNLETLLVRYCDNLLYIHNIDVPFADNKSNKEVRIDINGERLNSMQNIEKVLYNINTDKKSTCNLPVNFFIDLVKKQPELKENLKNISSNNIKWNETLANYNTQEMLMAYDRIEEIVGTVCTSDQKDFTQLSYLYRYFCDTKKYAENDEIRQDQIKNRKSLSLLFEDEAVCVGFSRSFDLCARYLGYNMQTCPCVQKSEEPYYDERAIWRTNHAISKLKFYDSATGQPYEYYFDLTWDLQTQKSKYFALTRTQMMKDHQFSLGEYKSFNEDILFNTPDLQEYLDKIGLLETSDRSKQIKLNLKQQAEMNVPATTTQM